MNLFESIKSNLNESNFGLDFEKNIPHDMRFKHYDFVSVTDDFGREKGESLYWVTQEPFDDLDLEHFRDAFVDTPYSDAYVTVRDLSSYDLNSDKDEGVLVHITKDGKIDSNSYMKIANENGWFNESVKFNEASDGSTELKFDLIDAVKSGVRKYKRSLDGVVLDVVNKALDYTKNYFNTEDGRNSLNFICKESDSPVIKLSDTYKVIDVPKGSITATPSIAREINNARPLDKEKYGVLMNALDDIITDIGSNEAQLKDLRDEVVSEFNRALGLKESEKLNEGAQPFANVGDGKYAKEVFNKLVDEATYECGHDPYNGTISTTNFGGSVIKIADTYSEEADVKAKEYIEKDDNGEKWVSKCLDLGELPDQPGVHRYVFYGWAAI